MNSFKKALLTGALTAPCFLVAGVADAQATSVAIADAPSAIGNAKALATANQQIEVTYKAQLDQANQRSQALRKEIEPLLMVLDTNKDQQVSDAEIAAAKTANKPEIAKIETAQQAANAQIAQLTTPAILAQAYVIEAISQKYMTAVTTVTAAKRIDLVVTPEAVVFNNPVADITPAITTEIDRVLPSVTTVVPAGWRPSRQTLQLQQQLQQMQQQAAALRAQQAGAAAPAPAAGTPAKPATTGR
ncbi:hypothetical protein BH09PSE4_BH09PSE4_03500 [soil metagenome]